VLQADGDFLVVQGGGARTKSDALLEELQASPAEIAYLRMRLVPSEGVELAQISALALEPGGWPEHYATLRYKIVGGNDLLPQRMATQLGERLQLGCEVVAISQTTQGAAVSFWRGQEHHMTSG
jgi:hypothetical protein